MTYEQLEEDKIYHCDWTAGSYKYIFRKKSKEGLPNKSWTGIDIGGVLILNMAAILPLELISEKLHQRK